MCFLRPHEAQRLFEEGRRLKKERRDSREVAGVAAARIWPESTSTAPRKKTHDKKLMAVQTWLCEECGTTNNFDASECWFCISARPAATFGAATKASVAVDDDDGMALDETPSTTSASTGASVGESRKTRFVQGKTKVDFLGAGKAAREEKRRAFALDGLSLLKGEYKILSQRTSMGAVGCCARRAFSSEVSTG